MIRNKKIQINTKESRDIKTYLRGLNQVFDSAWDGVAGSVWDGKTFLAPSLEQMHEMILDEDNMASDDDTKLATQQSIKAYADSLKTYFTLATTIQLTRNSFRNATSNTSGWGTFNTTQAFRNANIPANAVINIHIVVRASVSSYGIVFAETGVHIPVGGARTATGGQSGTGSGIIQLDGNKDCEYFMGNIALDADIAISVVGYWS